MRGVHETTLRRWAKLGLIDFYRVKDTGHRYYDVDGLLLREQARLRAKREKLESLTYLRESGKHGSATW
jgi:DNA-binding transcriptional MerR regulator